MKCVLGGTYYLANGKKFIPVSFEKGKILSNPYMSLQIGARSEGIYIDKEGKRVKKSNIYPTIFGNLKRGSKVSHEDYSNEIFIVTNIDKKTGIVTTKGGKNGTWTNHIDLIIRK